MSTFQNVTFEFKEKRYTIKANGVYRLIQQLHEIIPLSVILNPVSDDGKEKYSTFDVVAAYACCLNYAGADILDEEVFAEIFDVDEPLAPHDLLVMLYKLVIPPAKYQAAIDGDKEEVKKKKMTKA